MNDNILSAYFVAETSGNVCGYAGIWVVADECHIMTVAVLPEHRNAGIGAMLFMKLMEEARLRGASRYFLEVRASNAPAIGMYEKFGFKRIDLRKAYYEDNDEDAVIMMREDGADCEDGGAGETQADAAQADAAQDSEANREEGAGR
jgi:ribosomal-protein-alanine N-acetyltransferase